MEKQSFRVVTYVNGYPNDKKEFPDDKSAQKWADEMTAKFWKLREAGKTSHSYKYMVQHNY